MLSSMFYDWNAFDDLIRQSFEAMTARVVHSDKGVGYEFDLPGVKEEDIDVTVESGILTVKGERNGRTMTKSITLPRTIDVSGAEAQYDNGVLQLVFPLSEAAKPRRIELKNSSAKELT